MVVVASCILTAMLRVSVTPRPLGGACSNGRYRVGVRASGDGEAAVRWEEASPGLLTHTLTGLASSAAHEVSVLDVLTGVASDTLTMRTATPDAQ